MRVLVVEDEQKVANALREGLTSERYEVVMERTGEGAFYRANTERFDIILLDLMLPGRDGLDVLTALRHSGVDTPGPVLTARDTLEERILGLDSGADDYLVKPFAFEEMLARVRALVRRPRFTDVAQFSVGDLTLDVVARRVTREGQQIDLTVREFELLEYLMRHEGRIVSRGTLTRDVLKEMGRSKPLDNVIDVHIARLRSKIEAGQAAKLLHTVRGVGYILREGEP